MVPAILFTPLNLSFWGGLYPPATSILTTVDVSFWCVFKTATFILGVSPLLGMTGRRMALQRNQRWSRWMQGLSVFLFVGIVLFALRANFQYLVEYLGVVFDLVLIHNGVALATGCPLAYWTGLPTKDRQTLALETGIQNLGLGLILIFNFFDGLGGMAVLTGWWGVWHIVSGLGLSFYWRSRPVPLSSLQQP